MKKSTFMKRLPRQIGSNDDAEQTSSDSINQPDAFVKTPKLKVRKSTTPRASFGLGAGGNEDEDDTSGVITPKRANLSRVAIQRNASKRSSLLAANLPVRQSEEEDDSRPSYSTASLRELKDSTPSTPRDLGTELIPSNYSANSLDVASKFGPSQQASAIPSAAEIAEKKARRARMAKELEAEEYISLDPDDPHLDSIDDDENTMLDERGRLVLVPKDKYNIQESRLVRDDEDVMENFDEFTEDGKMPLGKKAEIEAAKRRRQDMAAQIAEAEAEESDSDESAMGERARNAAFEAVQTRHGAFEGSANIGGSNTDRRPRTPPNISPLPTLDSALSRLRKQMAELQTLQSQKIKEMDALRQEKIRLAEEEVRIQRNLKETAEKYKQIRAEKGIVAINEDGNLALPAPVMPNSNGVDVEDPSPTNGIQHDVLSDQTDTEAVALTSLAFADYPRGGLGMSRPRDEEDDW